MQLALWLGAIGRVLAFPIAQWLFTDRLAFGTAFKLT